MSSVKMATGLTEMVFHQKVDCCGYTNKYSQHNELKVEFMDGGGGTYFTIQTERFAFNDLEEVIALFRQVLQNRKQHDEFMRNAYEVIVHQERKGTGWEMHDGSVTCPVSKFATVEVKYKDGLVASSNIPETLDWKNIEMYKVITPF